MPTHSRPDLVQWLQIFGKASGLQFLSAIRQAIHWSLPEVSAATNRASLEQALKDAGWIYSGMLLGAAFLKVVQRSVR